MNLVIDIGNSFAKAALFDSKGGVVRQLDQPGLAPADVEAFVGGDPVAGAILSTTRHADGPLEEYLQTRFADFVRFDAHFPTPLRNRYDTPHTLGPDRLAAAVGAWCEAPENELLIFDFGSAITIDRVSAAGEFLGGNISPGVAMRFEALHRLTDRLPQVEFSFDQGAAIPPIGTTTADALRAGVLRGVWYEIDGYVADFRAEHPAGIIFFTGRDADFFARKIKNPIFASRNLLLKGLNYILESHYAQT